MWKEDLKDWTRDRLKDEIVRLHNKLDLFGIKFEENPNNFSFSYHGDRYWAGTIVNDIVALKEEKEKLMAENKALKQKIRYIETMLEASHKPESAESVMRKTGLFTEKQIRDICDYEPQLVPDDDILAFNYDCIKLWGEELDYKKKISELQDQHKQDCIKINQLHVTIDTLVDKYSRLRKNVVMD